MCSLEFDRKDISMNKLVATSLEGKFHVFDMRTQHPTKGFASVTEKVNERLSVESRDGHSRLVCRVSRQASSVCRVLVGS